jgi:putative ABC transport system ATP-binding protein
MSELIKAEGISKIYGSKNPIKALDNVNISIEEGEYVSIRGPSGSGKSTLLNIIGCLDKPTKGQLTIAGTDISTLGDKDMAVIRRDKVGFIFQTFNLLPILNAVENVELPMENIGISKNEKRDRAMKLLKTVGLSERWNHRPSELSGGERQRVAIARSLANNPSLLLADEPTGNLDSRTGKSIMRLLRELNHNLGTTVVVVTHDDSMAKKADRQLIVDDGKVKEKGQRNKEKTSLEHDLGLSADIAKKLKRAGFSDIIAVKNLSESQLSRVKGIKSKDIKKIRSKLRNYDG